MRCLTPLPPKKNDVNPLNGSDFPPQGGRKASNEHATPTQPLAPLFTGTASHERSPNSLYINPYYSSLVSAVARPGYDNSFSVLRYDFLNNRANQGIFWMGNPTPPLLTIQQGRGRYSTVLP